MNEKQGAEELPEQTLRLRQFLAENPGVREAWEALAQLLKRQGDRTGAEAACRRAVALAPEAAFTGWCSLALLLQENGELVEAEVAYRAALKIKGDVAGLWHNLAALFKASGRYAEAVEGYSRALSLQGDYPEGQYNLGNLYEAQGEQGAAEKAYRQAILLKPDYAEAHYNLGVVLKALGRLDAAEAAYRQAIALRASYSEARNNLGLVLQARVGASDGAAEAEYRLAIAQSPRYAEAHNNLGVVLQERQRYAEAEQEFCSAIAIRPDYHDARWNLVLMLLIAGRFAEAWPLFPARTQITRCQTFPPPLPFPEWQGESLLGKRILVWPEQGFGDEIQFCRYLSLLKLRGAAQVIVACKWPLKRLFGALEGVDICLEVSEGEVTVPRCDYWVFTMSLPAMFSTTLTTIPAQLPYLHADPADEERFEAYLPDDGAGSLRVGIVWQGSDVHPNDRNRSLPDVEVLAPLWAVPGVEFVSLQKGGVLPEENLSALPMLHLGKAIEDFADAAAIISQLDLVITVDTALAHLAGALGKPVWVMLPFAGLDWRWMLARSDSPWYPEKMRLFRQSTEGGWSNVISDLKLALALWREATVRSGIVVE